jgi:NADH:ubiquinone reductase (H+-translocating)
VRGGKSETTLTHKEKFMKKRIIIVGGGFAGLTLAKKLTNDRHFEVIVVDVNNYHFFPPLLYQVSTAFIEPSNISYPYRKLFQGRKNLRFHMGKLIKIIPETNTIETDSGSLNFDYLILAMGTETNFFGNENIKQHALPMKTIDDALNLRNHILLQMEKAVHSGIISDRRKAASIVIAGGGPTGVEMAGMLAEMSNKISLKDYPEITRPIGSIYLVDGSPALLGTMSKKAQSEAYHVLEALGVKIILNTLAIDYANDEVKLSNGERISSATVIWSTGVIAREVKGLSKEVITKGRRILVDEMNRVYGYENIFSIGDQCFQTTDKKNPTGHPQLAGVAVQQGKLLARNLKRLNRNRPTIPFTHNHKGAAAIISKYKAIVDMRNKSFKGFIAWFVWLFAHLLPLIGFRNKLKLAANWFWSFTTNNPTLRLIIRPDVREKEITNTTNGTIQMTNEKQRQS